MTINVTNVNEPPTITTGPTTESIAENTPTSTIVATYTASDVDASTTFSWTLQGSDAGDFTITRNSSGNGELSTT